MRKSISPTPGEPVPTLTVPPSIVSWRPASASVLFAKLMSLPTLMTPFARTETIPFPLFVFQSPAPPVAVRLRMAWAALPTPPMVTFATEPTPCPVMKLLVVRFTVPLWKSRLPSPESATSKLPPLTLTRGVVVPSPIRITLVFPAVLPPSIPPPIVAVPSKNSTVPVTPPPATFPPILRSLLTDNVPPFCVTVPSPELATFRSPEVTVSDPLSSVTVPADPAICPTTRLEFN